MKEGIPMRFAAVLIVGLALIGIAAPQAPRPDSTVFSRNQAARGQQLFARHCASCHSDSQAAALMAERGAGERLLDYHQRLSQLMPPQSNVKPGAQGYLDIIAHLMLTNSAPLGQTDASFGDLPWREARIPAPVAAIAGAITQTPALPWTYYRGDPGGTGYSTASQIDRTNVDRLRVAWRWSGANHGPQPEMRNITTPLMVDGVLYATAGISRNVIAIDATSGETLWMWRPQEDAARLENAPRKGAGRGVSYWSDGKQARIFTVTPGFHLAALDAKTGRPVTSFGGNGIIDLMVGMRGLPKSGLPDVGSQSPPLVIGNVIVVGPAHLVSFRPRAGGNVKGDVRGFDVRTGKLLWTFRTIPQAGDPGYETWATGTAERTGNGGVWAPMSADLETGAIFLPVEAGTSDLYGGARHGANAHTSSLVSLDARTGKLRWERQLVHHDIWDWDVPAIPILADLDQPGGKRKAVLQITKQGFVFAFDRNTGEPIWPIEERRVPASDVPGEQAWPTQPYPTLPKPFDRQGLKPDDLIDFTPALRAAAIEATKSYRFTDLYTPPSLVDASDGTRGILRTPHPLGGGNWEGGAFDPETGMLYIGSMTAVQTNALAANSPGSEIAYVYAGGATPTVRGLPIVKPPWGRITAIDMKTGQHAWMMANAETPAEVKNNPELRGIDVGRTGVASRAGLLVTKTLLFAGEGEGGSPMLRAHDKASGEILAEIILPGAQTGLPMTYVWGGKQYVAMAVSGAGPAEIVALSLPDQ
ncbi:MAG TPA: PQQ-binding-like beta-propeller repeat protein [Hyphomonadaceae bacterium]|nr:PQQ-binding-like beta-propeller repeat protein [Hyphomonadaceae bacterium]